ncbi:YcnI family protein [Frigoribacterium sp. CFBP9039]|uniref:YcnI family copper-binding membrane protein n=1 Tax=Frigoribacterium sp. CFBP9029 TaxID=3096541 RepID=UPI002A6AC932|nr:YcnI family protein [Frigoribacterium sp. CFBP9039]MDY0945695.1 YcnI family protein [Frigoribacterium sp. CFBP9039]
MRSRTQNRHDSHLDSVARTARTARASRASSASRTRPVAAALVAGAAGLALALGAPLAASAHVELEASSTAPATLSVLTFAVGHGCEGSPTTSLAIELPAGVQSVTPTVKPGWTITESAPPADPTVLEATTVTYTADTPLPDGFRDTVEISALLPVDGQAGDLVAFPTVQTCESGSYAWSELPSSDPDDPEPNEPAPALVLTDATSGAGATDSADGSATTATAADATAAAAPIDDTARLLGLAGLAVGVVAVVLLTIGLRRQQEARR